MAIKINDMDELAKALQPTMKGLVNQLANEVYEVLNYFLLDYYTGCIPSSYERTKAFLYSAVKTEAKMVRDNAVAFIYIDYNATDEYVNTTGFQVAKWANDGLHGGISVNHKPHVWNDTIDYIINNGSLL